ncbi:MAG TPA: SusC/RagA family TonB-linked outer membrane protein [Parasegetibacter sp.]
MNLTIILLTAATLSVHAVGLSQTVTFSGKNIKLKEMFSAIEQQTGYVVFYNQNDLANAKPVTLKARNKPLIEFLEMAFEDQPLSYRIADKTIILSLKLESGSNSGSLPEWLNEELLAQTVSGRIVDTSGNAVEGASVKLLPGNKGTTTGADGSFAIAGVQAGMYTLEISFVGYQTVNRRITVSDNQPLNLGTIILVPVSVTLEDVTVVTGYTVMDKRMSASSVTTIKGSDLERKDLFSVDNMLQGKVPGLNINMNSGTPGAAPKIRLRGTSTLVGNREPVWVVDGVIVESPVKLEAQEINSLDDINLLSSSIIGVNPNDIERIDILKDASATALYGVKGGNGVIVITTKRGRFNQPSQVSYNTNFRIGLKPRYTHFNLMNSEERVEVSKEITERALVYRFQPSRLGFEGAYLDYIDRNITFEEFNERTIYFGGINTDWFDILFRNSIDQTHNISVNGGGDKSNFYASLGYARQNGAAVFTTNERFTGLLKFNSQLSKNLLVSLKFSGAYNKGEYPYKVDPFAYAYNTSRALPFEENGTRFSYANVNSPGLLNEIQQNRHLFADFNIMDELEHSRQNSDIRTWDVTADVQWRFLNHFTYRGVVGLATSQTRTASYSDETTSYVAQNYREYYAVGVDIPSERKAFVEMPRGGEYTESNTFRNTYTIRNSLEYTRTLNDHFFQFTIGSEIRHNAYDVNKSFRLGYLPERGLSFYNPDRNEFPKYYIDIANGRFQPVTLSNKIERQTSLYGILIYSFLNRYTFNFNVRNDGSNRFGRDISDQFLPTYSAAFRWMISDENFMINSKTVDLLALRLSYGYNGNVPETESPRLIISQPTIDNISGVDQSTVVKYANPLLRWEKTQTVNAGLEFGLFNNRLNGEIDFYYKKGTDLIANISISPINGINSYALNQAAVQNHGYEAIIKYDAIRSKNWSWSVNLAMGKNFSKVLEANYQKSAELVGIDGFLKGNTVQPGVDPNAMYSFIFTGLDENGMPTFKDLFFESYNNIRPEISDYFANILVNSGSRIPDFDGSVSTSLRYKQFSFFASFIVKLGYVKRLENLYKVNGMIPAPHENTTSELVNRWRKPGDEAFTNIPKLTDENVEIITNASSNSGNTPYFIANYLHNIYNNSDLRVVKANHVRISSLAFQYTLPVAKGSRKFYQYAAVRLQGNDLFTFADKRFNGQDPETVNGTLPRLPSFSLSFDITF